NRLMASYSSSAAAVEIADAAPWVSKSSSPWVRGPLWDGFWMLSALWLAPIVLWLAHGYSNPETSPLDLLYFGLTALFWIGHRLSSTYLAYCTEAYRPLLRLEPIRFVVLPLAITAACFAIFLPGDSALPWTREERLIGLAIVDYAWVTYHFASQHFGALSLYRARADRGRCIQTRRLDRFFALTVGGVLVFVADILAGSVAYQDQWIDRWSFAAWLGSQTPRAEPSPTSGIVRGFLHRLNIRPWAVVLFFMALSVVLLPLFEVEANRETGTYYGDRIFGAFATQLRTSTWVPALLALG